MILVLFTSIPFLRHRDVNTSTTWLTLGQTHSGAPAATENAVPLEGGIGIVRAGRCVTASRRQRWPNRRLIYRDQGHQHAARPCHRVWDVRSLPCCCSHRLAPARASTLSKAADNSSQEACALAGRAATTMSAPGGSC